MYTPILETDRLRLRPFRKEETKEMNPENIKRQYYIDNLRILCIFLLFPFHTTMIYNTFGEPFYITGTQNAILNLVNVVVYPWWMTGLFVMAGMSTMYALGYRTTKQYIEERVRKLFIPLLSCLVFVIPMQTYIADIFHNGYEGNYFQHMKEFLILTDWGGYDGHFTLGHAWFVLYLFIISMVTLPLLLWYRKRKKKWSLGMPALLLMGIVPVCLENVLNIGGKSFAQFGAYFLIGYFVMSDENVIERLHKNSTWLGIGWILIIVLRCLSYVTNFSNGVWDWIAYFLLEWIGILAMLGLGKRFLDHNWRFTKVFVKAEFPLYLFHQTVIIMVGYWIMPHIESVYVEYVLIIGISFVLSYLLYEICRRFRVTRFLFAIKK